MKRLIIITALIIVLLTGCLGQKGSPNQENTNNPPKAENGSAKEGLEDLGQDNKKPRPEPSSPSQPIIEETPEEKLLKTMTLEQKVGQLVMVGFPGDTIPDDVKELITQYKIGGIILFKRNYNSFRELFDITTRLHELNQVNRIPLFIGADEEGGTVSRLPDGKTKIPDARLLGKIDDESLTRKTGQVIARELKAGGINMNFAPVLDIVDNPDNELLIRRAYGSTADKVSKHGTGFILGSHDEGVIACPKHFPGHGATTVDSHGRLPKIDISPETLQSRELVPFKNAVDKGVDAIMVGHLAFPNIDASGLPATMSKVFIQDILRKQLGFEGLVITDEVEMYGFKIHPTLEEDIMTSFDAGVDIFVIGHTYDIQKSVIDILTEGFKTGEMSMDRLDESVLRILKIKNKYNLDQWSNTTFEENKKLFGSTENQQVLEEINQRMQKLQ